MCNFGKKMATNWFPNLLNITAKNGATEIFFTNLKSTILDLPFESKHRLVAITGKKLWGFRYFHDFTVLRNLKT